MPRIPYANFCGPSYSGRSVSIATDRTINLYPEAVESGTGKNNYILVGTPGLKELCNTGTSEPIRGICTLGGKRILIAGRDTLYELNKSGEIVTLGSIAPDTEWNGLGVVTFAWNGTEYCISSGGKGYTLNGNTLAATIDMDQVQYLDGYFVALQAADRKVRLSGLYDGSTWNDLDFKEKESARDYPISILADHGELWVFGEFTSEVWYNSGNSDFPLERVPNGRLELGCAARNSVVKLDNSLFWIGNDERGNRVIWRADGYTAKRISNHAVEYALNLMIPQVDGLTIASSTTTFAIAWSYQEEGHSFYCVTFPNAPSSIDWEDKTYFSNPSMWVYDCATNMWHERAYWNAASGRYEPHRARCHGYMWDHHIVGDRDNGKLYEQHLNYYDDSGDRIRRERIGVHVTNGMKQLYFRSFQVDMDVAVGLGAIDSSLYGPDQNGVSYRP